MSGTTFLIERQAMAHREVQRCHDGEGPMGATFVLGGKQFEGRCIRFLHDNILPPGSSIGYHRHDSGEEYYLVLSGHGTMQLDGEEYPIGPGDISAVFAGGSHGLINDGDEDMRLIVFFAAVAEQG